MDKKIIIISGIIAFIIFGFLMGAIIDFKPTFCTQKGCYCHNQLEEIPCNDCGSSDPLFMTFIINVEKDCSSKEIVICENDKAVGKRFDVDYGSCKHNLKFFGGTIDNWILSIRTLLFGYPGSEDIEEVSVGQTSLP